MIPTKKISLTLLEYAEPMIDGLDEGYSKSDLEAVLKLATCVWNACVLDQRQRSTRNVGAVRQQLLHAEHPMQAAIIEALIVRKQHEFGHDPRAITNECVLVKNGGFVVRAEARLDIKDISIEGSRPM